MKVRIGKYPSRLTCNLYSNYMNKKYGYVVWPSYTHKSLAQPKSQPFAEAWREKAEEIIQICYTPINYFLDKRTQKVKVKIEAHDTWSMDHTLSYIILPMLKQLKDTKHGAPWVAVADVPRELRPTKKQLMDYQKDGTTDPKFFERWDWVLDEMIFAFESKVNDNWEDQFWTGEHDIQWKELEDGNHKIIHGPKHTAKWDREGQEKYHERIKNGFRLFGSYYENLWD